MNTKAIDGPEALRLLREVVGERPDFVYAPPVGSNETCMYVWQGQPSCVVAHVLVRAGYDIDTIANLDPWGLIDSARSHVRAVRVNDEAAQILTVAQTTQDNSAAWSEALDAAENRARFLKVSA